MSRRCGRRRRGWREGEREGRLIRIGLLVRCEYLSIDCKEGGGTAEQGVLVKVESEVVVGEREVLLRLPDRFRTRVSQQDFVQEDSRNILCILQPCRFHY